MNQSINFFSELDLDNNDFETIYEKFKFLLENYDMQDIFRKISQIQNFFQLMRKAGITITKNKAQALI